MQATLSQPSRYRQFIASVGSAWDLLIAVTLRDVRVRYQGTVLSFIWWIARPLALGTVLYFALGRVLRLDIPNYSIFLLSALFPWFWFAGAVQQATGSFTGNGGLLKKVQFPKLILPLSAVFFNTVQFMMTLPILIAYVLVSGIDPTVAWIAGIPALMALQLLLMIGLGTLLAALNVFIRDLAPLVDVVLLMMFYMSAIIFPLELVPDEFRPLMVLNPIAPLIDAWRNLFLYGEFLDADIWPALALTVVALVLGLTVFRRMERHFADAL